MQLPNFGAGPSLYIPLAGVAAMVIVGQISSQVQKGTKGWSPTVRSRIRSTYTHFGASLAVWAATAVMLWKTGLVPSNLGFLILDFALSLFLIFKVLLANFAAHSLLDFISFSSPNPIYPAHARQARRVPRSCNPSTTSQTVSPRPSTSSSLPRCKASAWPLSYGPTPPPTCSASSCRPEVPRM